MPADNTSSSARPSVREAVLDLLRQLGIDTVFGNPGSTELPMFREYPEDFHYVLGLQEAVVVGMADGYAQATRNAALVNLHSAAGVGHAMGNIFTAFKNQTPLLITAGQQARSILPFPRLGTGDRAAKTLRQMGDRAGARRRPAARAGPGLPHRHAAAARPGLHLDPGR
jgi:glyoxylate carboligase